MKIKRFCSEIVFLSLINLSSPKPVSLNLVIHALFGSNPIDQLHISDFDSKITYFMGFFLLNKQA
jgi:hypothetical protein